MDKPKREAILDLSKYVNERIRVKFTGGREGIYSCCYPCLSLTDLPVTGILKGYDQLLNLVLDEVEEEILGKLSLSLFASTYQFQNRKYTIARLDWSSFADRP